ncbi:MAG: hypothetical protein ACPL1D_01660, partial [Microgenomates group bacterium]
MKKTPRIVYYLIIITAAILTLLPYLVDGQIGCVKDKCGFIFGSNFRDGMWFMAVANVAFQKFPFLHPTYAGETLKGYHFLPNFLVFALSKIGISSFFSYFKLIPILYFLLITFVLCKTLKKINNNLAFINLGLFFFYFGIPLTLLTALLNNQPLNNGLLINTFQATRVLESPHTAIGLVIILIIFYWLLTEKINQKWPIFLFLLFFSFGIKFYVATTLSLIIIFYLFLNVKKDFIGSIKKFFSLVLTALMAILIFLQPSSNQSPTFNFSPFATVHHLIESPNLFYNKNLVLARYFLYEKGLGPRLLAIELYSLFLFVFFYLGTRFLGIFYFLKHKFKTLDLSIFFTFITSVFLSAFFVQRGDWFNPIQFLVPNAYILSLYTAIFFYNLYKKNKALFTIFFIPTFIFTFIPNLINLNYPFSQSRFVINQYEIEALNFLKKQPFGAVFTPIDKNDTSYVAAFSGKPTYLNFLTINETLGVDFRQRLKQINNPDEFN